MQMSRQTNEHIYTKTKAPPTTTPTRATRRAFRFNAFTSEVYESFGPYIPPGLFAPGLGAPPSPPPSTLVGAVGRLLGVVDDVMFVEFLEPEAVLFPVGRGVAEALAAPWVMVKTTFVITVVRTLLGPKMTVATGVVVSCTLCAYAQMSTDEIER